MDQLKLLMDYTQFHIAFYLTFASIGVALIKLKITTLGVLWPSFLGLLLAGVAGGVIGSSIPLYDKFAPFSTAQLGFWGWEIAPFKTWAFLEHIGFWFAILWGIAVVLCSGTASVDTAIRKHK
jgi:hypothetical protein